MDSVAAAVAAIARQNFVPGDSRVDAPIAIGYGQTNSQPSTVAAMLRLLDVRRGHTVLDVGAGSGWTTALLAHLVGAGGVVRGVEIVPALVEFGSRNLQRTGQPWASIVQADDGVLGLPRAAPYDRILVSAQAGELPQSLVDQLGEGGRLVIPVAGEMTLVERDGDALRVSTHGRYRFVPLIG